MTRFKAASVKPTITLDTSESYSRRLDVEDPLAKFRERFYIPNGSIYVDGNSLGLLCKDSENSIHNVLDDWRTLGIGGWLGGKRPWFYFAEQIGAMCSSLVGAEPDEVILTGTTTVNIHQLVHTFYEPHRSRRKIIADELDFPSDIYALRSILNLRRMNPDQDLILAPSVNSHYLEEDDIVKLMDEEVAMVFLPSVLYRSGQLLDLHYLTEEAHKRDILIGFDCCHSVGAVPHYFDKWGVDFALWCGYKYLNGGPGSTAFLYVNKSHFGREPALAGWFGYVKEKQFDMSLRFEHSETAGGWQISSPAILSAAPLEGSLKVLLEAGIDAIRAKSLKMTSYFTSLIDKVLSQNPFNFSIRTPREEARRGGHVAVEHKEALRISKALRSRGVVPDFRPPNIIRIAPMPLYNTFHETWQVVQNIKEIVEKKEYERYSKQRKAIS
jgi:kynureninase